MGAFGTDIPARVANESQKSVASIGKPSWNAMHSEIARTKRIFAEWVGACL